MPSRRQKRAKRARRHHHQEATATGTKYMNYDDGTQIEVPRGPKPSVSRHRTDKPRFGANRQSIEDGIRSIFTKAGVEPTDDEMARALELSGGNKANDRLARFISSVLMARLEGKGLVPAEFKNGSKVEILPGTGEANSGPHPPRFHADEVELMDRETFDRAAQIQADKTRYGFSASMAGTGERIDPADIKAHDGTFTLTVNGKTTDPIPYDAPLEELRRIGEGVGLTIEKVMASHDKLTLEAGDQTVEIKLDTFRQMRADETITKGIAENADRPTLDEWAELEATAKKRKRGAKGYITVLEKAGYRLISDGLDARERESWVHA
jgi:SOS-response transcriptional repressor LexA